MRFWKTISIISITAFGCAFVLVWALFGLRSIIGAKSRPLTNRRFEFTPSRHDRGQYLVEYVARCPYCHSELDWTSQGAPPKLGKALAGRVWTPYGFPWLVS